MSFTAQVRSQNIRDLFLDARQGEMPLERPQQGFPGKTMRHRSSFVFATLCPVAVFSSTAQLGAPVERLE